MDLSAKVSNLEGRIQKLEGRTDEGTIESGAGISSFPPVGSPGSLYVDTTTGQVYTWNGSAYVPAGGGAALSTVRQVVATSYTLQASDDGNILYLMDNTAFTLIVPAGLRQGFSCAVWQGALGTITVTASGVTLLNADNMFKSRKQNSGFTIQHIGSNFIMVQGDLMA